MEDPLDIPEPDEPEEEGAHPGRPYIAIMIAGRPDPYVFSLKDWHYVGTDRTLSLKNDSTNVRVAYNVDHILFTEVAK
jgi:hypothetical protein